ncbi:hypothetical protein M758_7G029000 [Ceratodon purpureus]|nr:hypothetical protein M758_7G029000 [Ceratodon purpureus]
MGTVRNVWLPGAGVWACLPELADAVERDYSPSSGRNGTGRCDDREVCETSARKRRKGLSLGDGGGEGDEGGLGLRVEDEEQGASSSNDDMCPICLGDIEEAGEAVLQWCMHRFCTHCIEEWSKVRRVCPLCKAEYRGWYHGVQSNNEFQERVLPPVAESSAHQSRGDAASRFRLWRDSRRQERGRGSRLLQPRGHGVAPDASASSSSKQFGRSAPFPTQRSFGLPRQHQSAQAMRILEEQAAAKALQWRKSIYNRNLRARPFEIGKRSMVTKDAKARAERRLEPWIRRELLAVLPNSDHAFLSRLILGLWFGAEHEPIQAVERQGSSSGQRTISNRNVIGSTETGSVREAEAVKELKRFLGDKAELLWHELRCFAESPFTMQAYDTVVVYTRQDNLRRPINRTDGRSSHQDSGLDSRRRSESTAPRLTSRPLNNEEPGHLESNHQILRAGRHSISHSCVAEGVPSSSGQHRKEISRDNAQTSRALLARDPRADQRKKRPHADAIPIAEDRWQLSYC